MSNLCFFHRRTSRYPAMESECGRTLLYRTTFLFIVLKRASMVNSKSKLDGNHFVLEVCVLDTGNSVELHIDKSLSYVATCEVDQIRVA